MKNVITTLSKAIIVVSASLAFCMSAQAASFAKYEGVDGESKANQQSGSQQQSTPKKLDSNTKPQRALLLPAVQSAREAARASSVQTPKKTK